MVATAATGRLIKPQVATITNATVVISFSLLLLAGALVVLPVSRVTADNKQPLQQQQPAPALAPTMTGQLRAGAAQPAPSQPAAKSNPAPLGPAPSSPVAPVAPAPASVSFQPLIEAALAAVAPTMTSLVTGKTGQSPTLVQQPQLAERSVPKLTGMAPATSGASALPVAGSLSQQQEEPIVQLDYSNIDDEVLNKRTANLIYFNANFNKCTNCNRFYAIWRELALDIRWWRHLIRLFIINCSDEDNIEVCRRAGVTQFPQLKFYWVMSGSLSQDGQRLRILGKSVHAMRHLITDKLMDSYTEHNRLLAQRAIQRASAPAIPSPFGALSSLISAPSAARSLLSGDASAASPLSALMPMVSQFLGGGGGGSLPGNITSSASGLLSGIMSFLGGGGSKQAPGVGPTGTSGGGPVVSGQAPTITSLMSSIGGMQGITQMVDALVSLASWRRSLTLQPLPSNWPELEPIDTSDPRRLLSMLPLDPGKGVGALLIMETKEFLYTGLEVMLDLNPYSNQTYIARVRDERSQLSKNLTGRDDIQGPALIFVTEHREIKLIMTAPKYSNDEDLRRLFVRAFERRQARHLKRVWSTGSIGQQQQQQQIQLEWSSGGSGSGGGGASSSGGSKSLEDEEILSRMNNVYMADLLNTIRASLMDQVLRHSDLSDDQYNALVKYVYALINYFPFNNDERLKFFKRLHVWLQNQVSPIDMAEYKKQFHDIDEALGKRRDWIACKSLSSVNTIPSRGRKSMSSILFENPSQLGKVVSNITRLFRANQQKVGQLKNLVGMFTSNLGGGGPVRLTQTNQQSPGNSREQQQQLQQQFLERSRLTTTTTTTTEAPRKSDHLKEGDDASSSIERLMKSLTSGSLGSDSSILKLISRTLTGDQETGGSDDRDSVSPSSSSYSSSKRGAPSKSKFAREYSCGAWKLAHVMVVNEYLKDSPRKDVKHIVLHSLYQYAMHFYACSTCGNRVSDISGEFKIQLEDHLLDQSDSILLLWKVHNRINKRLEAEFRPGSPPKQQFPNESLCARCRTTKVQNDSILNSGSPNWQEKQVLHFLVHHYWPQSIITSLDSGSSTSSSSASSSPSAIASSMMITNLVHLAKVCVSLWSTIVLSRHLAPIPPTHLIQ